MGSIPIARSHSQATPDHAGLQDGFKKLILWESVGNARRLGACLIILRYPYVAPCYTRRRGAPMPAPPTMCGSTSSVGAVSR